MEPIAGITANSFIYEALVARLGRRKNPTADLLVDEVHRVANFAWRRHPGIFADGRVENVLLGLDDYVAKAQGPCSAAECFADRDRSRTLHVATELYAAGGHSRVLSKWIDRDLASNHCVVLTHQVRELPALTAATCNKRGAKIITLPVEASKLCRAAALRRLAKQADRVILHHHPDDPIPVLAFATPGGPPVAYFNHAHFWYSLGGTVADITLNTLPYFLGVSERFRFPRRVALLSGVSGNREFVSFDKEQGKRDLGLDPNVPVLLTIGHESYFRPTNECDFFATLEKALATNQKVQVLVVGVPPTADFLPEGLLSDRRVRFYGSVADPVPYYHAADLCLESFPHSSLGGFLEAVAYGGAFPIPAYAASENILRVDLPPLPSVSPRPKSEAEYLEFVAMRLAQLSETRRLGSQLQRTLQEVDEKWPSILQEIYGKVDALSHAPGPIPGATCSFDNDHQILAALSSSKLPEDLCAHFSDAEIAKLNLKSLMQGVVPLGDVLRYHAKAARRASNRLVERFTL